jgi:prepilin-type N-terminal cleavage/methylation domain-containing protein
MLPSTAVRRPRGFTLIEMMTALVILAVMASLSIAALNGLKGRGNFVSATGDLIEGLRLTRAEAYGRQAPCVFVVDTVGNRWWSIANLGNNFSLDTFNPSSPTPSPDILLGSGTLPTSVTFGPGGSPGGYGAALPQPYGGVPSFSSSSPAPAFPYCSFCRTGGTNTGFGTITFYGAGSASFSVNAGTPVGHSFTIQAPKAVGAGLQIMTFAVVARTGAPATFETSL